MNQILPEGLSGDGALVLDLEFDLWVRDGACAHPNMRIASERISNWGGLRKFQHALRELGEQSYPALLRALPATNDGLTEAADARACLAELDRFCAAGRFGVVVDLVDAVSGEVVHSRIGPYDGWLSTKAATGISTKLNLDGMFQVERGKAGTMQHDPDAEILFRSKAFSQERTAAGSFCFTDLASGKRLLHHDGVRDVSGRYPASLEVNHGPDNPARYEYCVEPLRRVFRAAVETGHPVLWS